MQAQAKERARSLQAARSLQDLAAAAAAAAADGSAPASPVVPPPASPLRHAATQPPPSEGSSSHHPQHHRHQSASVSEAGAAGEPQAVEGSAGYAAAAKAAAAAAEPAPPPPPIIPSVAAPTAPAPGASGDIVWQHQHRSAHASFTHASTHAVACRVCPGLTPIPAAPMPQARWWLGFTASTRCWCASASSCCGGAALRACYSDSFRCGPVRVCMCAREAKGREHAGLYVDVRVRVCKKSCYPGPPASYGCGCYCRTSSAASCRPGRSAASPAHTNCLTRRCRAAAAELPLRPPTRNPQLASPPSPTHPPTHRPPHAPPPPSPSPTCLRLHFLINHECNPPPHTHLPAPQSKLDAARLPGFLHRLVLEGFDLGCSAPQLRDMRAVSGERGRRGG